MSEDGKWMYELHGSDIWRSEKFDTREECIKEAQEDLLATNENNQKYGYKTIEKFMIGQVESVTPSGVDIDSILENVAENTTEEVGEAGEDYLWDVKREHQNELEEKMNEVLFSWMKKYGYEPGFFKIVNVEEIVVK